MAGLYCGFLCSLVSDFYTQHLQWLFMDSNKNTLDVNFRSRSSKSLHNNINCCQITLLEKVNDLIRDNYLCLKKIRLVCYGWHKQCKSTVYMRNYHQIALVYKNYLGYCLSHNLTQIWYLYTQFAIAYLAADNDHKKLRAYLILAINYSILISSF